MKYFLIGLLRLTIFIVAMPILIPLFIIDIIFIIGGQDPFHTPIRRLLNKYL